MFGNESPCYRTRVPRFHLPAFVDEPVVTRRRWTGLRALCAGVAWLALSVSLVALVEPQLVRAGAGSLAEVAATVADIASDAPRRGLERAPGEVGTAPRSLTPRPPPMERAADLVPVGSLSEAQHRQRLSGGVSGRMPAMRPPGRRGAALSD